MGIKPTTHCVETVFGVKYYIDFYQRDYKWGSDQIETLLSDIFFRFDVDYRSEVDPTLAALDQYAWYYLNTLVTNELDGKLYVVDGQQRLTTLTLILIYLHHRCVTAELASLSEWLKSKICGFHAEGKTFWMGTGSREQALEALFNAGTVAPGEPGAEVSIRNMFVNFGTITRVMDEKLPDEHKLETFVLYFMKRIELVQLHIDDSRDVAMVFEVINDRGEPLKPYEVFKGELLGQLTKTEIDDQYLQLWLDSIGPLQDIDDREPDRFFRLLFRSKYTSNRNEYRDFEGEYQRVVFSGNWDGRLSLKRNPPQVKRFLREQVVWLSNVYRNLLRLYQKEGSYVYFNGYLNDHDRQYLLILSAISEQDPEYAEKIELVSRLFDRNFTLLRLTGSYDTNEFTDSIIALNPRIRNGSLPDIRTAFDGQLLADIQTVRGVSTDDPFQWSLFRNSGYELGSRFVRYFFARIEHFIGANAKVPVDGYYNLVRNSGQVQGYHVEHVLAENSENRALFGNDEETFLQERNRLGALVLLKGRDNQSSSNETYDQKTRTYAHSTRLAATLTSDFYHSNPDFSDFMRAHGLNFEPIAVFDQDAVESRHRLYFEMAKQIWGDESFPRS